MGQEIERKFLLKNQSWRQYVAKSTIIKQGFLNTAPERTVRVRTKGNKGFLTVKGKNKGAVRVEFEYEIPLQDAQELLLLCQKPLIEKERFIVHHNGLTWEIDVFEGENKGLEVAEVELESENQIIALPDWIDKEVTNDIRYYNSVLSQNPYSNWKKEHA